ncbi:hypothetical protein [uncultured Enterococcus sp.]|uniref:hypothetical protein n=1 Tax=uncultured Enterococcus sp. TaxID=167972 RepID=UPI002AA61177|nr:hypothetical protein [uncultured Enterococcus sp.]
MFGWLNKTGTEQKRDDYHSLYQSLKNYQTKVETELTDAEETMSTYKSSVPNLSNSKVPSRHFDQKREEYTAKLEQMIKDEKSKKTELVQAKNKAKEQYEKYKQQAINEENARKAKEEKKRKEDLEKLKEALLGK